jgi:hypothetical protein
MFLAKSDITLGQRLSRYPSLNNRIELLLNIIEASAGDCQSANEAEMRVIEELRKMGSEALNCWSEHKIMPTTEDFAKANSTAIKSGKTLMAHYLRRDSCL